MKMNNKPTWLVGMIGGIIMAFSLMGCGTVHTEIVIPASPFVIPAPLFVIPAKAGIHVSS